MNTNQTFSAKVSYPTHDGERAQTPLTLRCRRDKARFARLKLDTLQAAIRAEDWLEVENSALRIAQAALWLQLSDAEIEANA